MITIQVPNGKPYELRYAVFDFNGTLAKDGLMTEEVRQLLKKLSAQLDITVITADTFGRARQELLTLPEIELVILDATQDGTEKARLVQELGPEHTVVIGNGANDQAMFFISALKICVLGPEGTNPGLMSTSNLVVTSPKDAIELLLKPERLIASLRS